MSGVQTPLLMTARSTWSRACQGTGLETCRTALAHVGSQKLPISCSSKIWLSLNHQCDKADFAKGWPALISFGLGLCYMHFPFSSLLGPSHQAAHSFPSTAAAQHKAQPPLCPIWNTRKENNAEKQILDALGFSALLEEVEEAGIGLTRKGW